MDGFDVAEAVFLGRIEEILGNIRVREMHTFFVRWQGELFQRESLRRELRSDLNRALSVKSASETVLYRGLLLQLYGAFERLIADLAQSVLSDLEKKAKRYEDLDENLRNAYTVGSSKILSKLPDRSINGVNFDFVGFQSNLAACLSNSQSFRLDGAAFTAFLGVCTSERVDWVFKTLRLGKAFDDALGRDDAIKSWAQNAGPREAYKRAAEKLDDTVRLRNQIAHGASDPEVLSTDLTDIASFLEVLGVALLTKAKSGCAS